MIANLSIVKKILGSNIYAKLLFLHVLARVFKKLLLNKHLQELALVFTTSSKSHEEMECDGMKKGIVLFLRVTPTIPSIPDAPNNLFRN